MPRESSLEQRVCRLWLSLGAVDCVKLGKKGYPDRQVLLGGGTHFWAEFKTKEGTLTPAQKVRIPKLWAKGESVFVVNDFEHARRLFLPYMRGIRAL